MNSSEHDEQFGNFMHSGYAAPRQPLSSASDMPPHLVNPVETAGVLLRHRAPRHRIGRVAAVIAAGLVAIGGGAAYASQADNDSGPTKAHAAAVTPVKPMAVSKTATPKPTAAVHRTPVAARTTAPAKRITPTLVTTTPAPVKTTYRYVVDPVELAQAEAGVAQAEQTYRRALADSYATKFDRNIAGWELQMAAQHLADLKAGNPNGRNLKLEIKGAKIYLAQAEANYRRAMVDPQGGDADRAVAKADLMKWKSTVQNLEGQAG